MPELPEVEVVRRGLAAARSAGRTVAVGRGPPPARGPPARAGCRRLRRTADRPPADGHGRRGKYLWLPLDGDGDAPVLVAHLGMSGQLLVQPAGAADERAPARAADAVDDGRELRFVDQRTFGGLSVAALDADGVPDPVVAHRARPARPGVRRRGVRRRRCAAGGPGSSGPCWTRPWSPGSATSTPTRRCGARGCTTPAPPTRCAGPRSQRLLGHVRDVMDEALGGGRHVVRRAVRRRQRRERLLRPVARRRTGRRASRARAAARRSAATRS